MPLSVEKGEQWSPVWSPDGRATAFVVRSGIGEPAQIYIRALDEPAGRLIARRDTTPAIAQWTTAGKILFWERKELWSVSPVGAPPEFVAAIENELGIGADITRDGKTVATVARGEDGSFGIWTATPLDAELERYEPAPFAARRHYNARSCGSHPTAGSCCCSGTRPIAARKHGSCRFLPTRVVRRIASCKHLPALGGTPQSVAARQPPHRAIDRIRAPARPLLGRYAVG